MHVATPFHTASKRRRFARPVRPSGAAKVGNFRLAASEFIGALLNLFFQCQIGSASRFTQARLLGCLSAQASGEHGAHPSSNSKAPIRTPRETLRRRSRCAAVAASSP